MKTKDVEKIRKASLEAQAKPWRGYQVIIEGFRFDIYWRTAFITNKYLFVVPMFYKPGWGHCNHIYADTIDELIEKIDSKIQEAKELWTNGGEYSENYFDYERANTN